jgi:hypothetical protein
MIVLLDGYVVQTVAADGTRWLMVRPALGDASLPLWSSKGEVAPAAGVAVDLAREIIRALKASPANQIVARRIWPEGWDRWWGIPMQARPHLLTDALEDAVRAAREMASAGTLEGVLRDDREAQE